MYLDDIIAIHSRLSNVPAALRATANTAGTPAVLIACKTAREAEVVAWFIRHARADMIALLKELGERKEAEQAEMFTDAAQEARPSTLGIDSTTAPELPEVRT